MNLFPFFFAYSGSFKSQGYSCIRLTSGVRFPFLRDSELQERAGIRLLFFSFILFPFYRQFLYYLEKEEQLTKGYGCRLWDNTFVVMLGYSRSMTLYLLFLGRLSEAS